MTLANPSCEYCGNEVFGIHGQYSDYEGDRVYFCSIACALDHFQISSYIEE